MGTTISFSNHSDKDHDFKPFHHVISVLTSCEWESEDIEDPEETDHGICTDREIVEALRINHLLSQTIVSSLLGSEKAPIHVIVPDSTIEGGNKVRDDIHPEFPLISGDGFLTAIHDENKRHHELGEILAGVVEVGIQSGIVVLVEALCKSEPEWEESHNMEVNSERIWFFLPIILNFIDRHEVNNEPKIFKRVTHTRNNISKEEISKPDEPKR